MLEDLDGPVDRRHDPGQPATAVARGRRRRRDQLRAVSREAAPGPDVHARERAPAAVSEMQAAADEDDAAQAHASSLRAFDAPLLADIRKYTIVAAKRFEARRPDGAGRRAGRDPTRGGRQRRGPARRARRTPTRRPERPPGMAASFGRVVRVLRDGEVHARPTSTPTSSAATSTSPTSSTTSPTSTRSAERKDTRVMKWIYAENDVARPAAPTTRTAARCGPGSAHADIQAADTPDIRAGDLVLIDNRDTGRRRPHRDGPQLRRGHQHAATRSAATTAATRSTHADAQGATRRVARRPGQARALEDATGQPLKPGGGGHSASPRPRRQPDGTSSASPQVRIYGIGRPSIVDFEDHRYDTTNAEAPAGSAGAP